MTRIEINRNDLTLDQIRAAPAGPIEVSISAASRERIEASRKAILDMLGRDAPIYGVNTGFGKLASQRIGDEDLAKLQRNIVRSHAAGIGKPLNRALVRLVMLLKIKALAQGHSGISADAVDALVTLVNADVLPVIPRQGSVGASGDLAPLAHMSLVLMGEGDAMTGDGQVSGAEALALAGLAPVRLGPKEGLALLNGTQVSTALALDGLIKAERTMQAAVVAGAMSVDAIMGSDAPFDPRVHALRGHAGQIALAASYRKLLEGSEIRASHVDCERVQDPYSFRCQPQVMGACLDLLRTTASTLVTEANAVTDNPLVFSEEGEVISGGNFHAEPVAFAADMIALALAEMGSLSERRLAAIIDPTISDLPAFLTTDPGLNSGHMLGQVTAAALVAENKQLSAPASVDSIPTSANQEDHVSMATHGAWRLRQMNANAAAVVGIELLAAAEGIDFRRPLRSSSAIESAHALVREKVKVRETDRTFTPDIEAAVSLIKSGALAGFTGALI